MGQRARSGGTAGRAGLIQKSPEAGVAQGIFGWSYLLQLARHLGVEAAAAPVAAALGISTATLLAGLAVLATTFVGVLAIPRIIEYVTGKKQAAGPGPDVRLALLNYFKGKAYWAAGKKVYLRKLGDEHRKKNCHNYAFGGLQGAYEQFHFDALAEKLGAQKSPEEFRKWEQEGHRVPLDIEDDEEYFKVDEEFRYGAFDKIDFSTLPQPVDVSTALNLPNDGTYTIRIYGSAHSARQENGKWWHKFTDLPHAYLVSVEGNENLSYATSAEITIRSCAAQAGPEESIVMQDE
jgi:hypothetical protein